MAAALRRSEAGKFGGVSRHTQGPDDGAAQQRREPAAMPREVRIASALLTALGVVLTINAVISLLFRDDLQAAVADDVDTLVSPSQVRSVLVVAAVVLLLLGALLILSGAQIRRGRQWARVLSFVTAGILILLTGIGAMAGAGLLAVAVLGASVGVVALLMQAAVADFFERDPARPDQP